MLSKHLNSVELFKWHEWHTVNCMAFQQIPQAAASLPGTSRVMPSVQDTTERFPSWIVIIVDQHHPNFIQDYKGLQRIYPICSMYGIFTYIYPKNQPNVGKYAIHGASGYGIAPELIVNHKAFWRLLNWANPGHGLPMFQAGHWAIVPLGWSKLITLIRRILRATCAMA